MLVFYNTNSKKYKNAFNGIRISKLFKSAYPIHFWAVDFGLIVLTFSGVKTSVYTVLVVTILHLKIYVLAAKW